ncbi:hypothetical protein GCM10023185_38410 [Hymenobacter saemangeumensis]|uniref:J domain-containing protein n=1 Tax=Hymenobacter saemangeumensis TaxID=1084522 RepID=A0ABP8IQZ7_9BACT
MTHYQALELPETASQDDIRRAYRRLVLLTHPDRTPDPVAHGRYLAVIAAYDTLSDPARRQAYDRTLHSKAFTSELGASPGRRRDAAARGFHAPRRVATVTVTDYDAEHARFYRLFRPILIAALIICLGVMGDYLLARESPERVQRAELEVYHSGGSRHSRRQAHYYLQYTTDQGTFNANDADDEIPPGTLLLIKRTPLFRTALAAHYAQAQSKGEPIPLYGKVS